MRWFILLGCIITFSSCGSGGYSSNRGYVISKSPVEAESSEVIVDENEDLVH